MADAFSDATVSTRGQSTATTSACGFCRAMVMPKMPWPAAMSSTRCGPALATPRISPIACAGIAIIGSIARANFSHTGFSSVTVLDSSGTVPRRTAAVRPSKFRTIRSEARNSSAPPK